MKIYLIIIHLFWFAFRPNHTDFNYCKIKAKHVADSIIYSLVDKNKFKTYYEFKKDFNSSIIEKGSNNKVFWDNEFYNKPVKYNLTYAVKKSTIINAELTIELDSNFKLQKIYNLTDNQYFQDAYLSQKKIILLVNSFNFKDVTSLKYIYDTIQNSKTFRPFIEVKTFLKSSKGDCENCSTIIDSCYKIDPTTKTIIRRYHNIIKTVSQS